MKHPLREFTWYGVKKRLKGRRSKQLADKSCFEPVYYPKPTLRIFLTPKCNGNCPYCTNQQYSEAKSQYDYEHLAVNIMAQGLKRFYGLYQYYFSGGECALLDEFPQLIQEMNNANIVILTNLSDKSVENINKIGKTNNNILLDVSCHPHMMELSHFIENCKQVNFEKKVHVVYFPEIPVVEIIGKLREHGIRAFWSFGYQQKVIRKTVAVICKATNFHVAPDGGIHPCRTRTVLNRVPLGYVYDDKLDIFNSSITCSDYPKEGGRISPCAACDILKEIDVCSG